MKRVHAFPHLLISGLLSVPVASCEGPQNAQQDFMRDLGEAMAMEEAEPGPCEICDQPSDSKGDRRMLNLDGQLIEFCCQGCAEQFYSAPNWRQYKKE